MTRKQCKKGDHLKPGDTYLEDLVKKTVTCLKCLKKDKNVPPVEKFRWGFYKRTVFHK